MEAVTCAQAQQALYAEQKSFQAEMGSCVNAEFISDKSLTFEDFAVNGGFLLPPSAGHAYSCLQVDKCHKRTGCRYQQEDFDEILALNTGIVASEHALTQRDITSPGQICLLEHKWLIVQNAED